MICDIKHRLVVQRVKVVLRDTALPSWLIEWNCGYGKTNFAQEPAKVWIWIIDVTQNINRHPVKQAGTSDIFD